MYLVTFVVEFIEARQRHSEAGGLTAYDWIRYRVKILRPVEYPHGDRLRGQFRLATVEELFGNEAQEASVGGGAAKPGVGKQAVQFRACPRNPDGCIGDANLPRSCPRPWQIPFSASVQHSARAEKRFMKVR